MKTYTEGILEGRKQAAGVCDRILLEDPVGRFGLIETRNAILALPAPEEAEPVTAEHLAPESDSKAHRRCKCEFSGGGVWAKKCAFHDKILATMKNPNTAPQGNSAADEGVNSQPLETTSLPAVAVPVEQREPVAWADYQEFHERCMDYRSASPEHAQIFYERLQSYITNHAAADLERELSAKTAECKMLRSVAPASAEVVK